VPKTAFLDTIKTLFVLFDICSRHINRYRLRQDEQASSERAS